MSGYEPGERPAPAEWLRAEAENRQFDGAPDDYALEGDECEGAPVAEALTTFPLQIAVFCDRCGTEVRHDYLVHDLMTREQRLAVAREHLARNEGWSCTAAGDFCPDHEPATEESR